MRYRRLSKSLQKDAFVTILAPTVRPLSTRVAAIAITVMFAVNGMLLGGYGGSLPSLREKLGLDSTTIALMLFCGGVAGITSMQIGGRLADSMGARRITLVALPVLMPSILGAIVLLFGNAFGAQATAYQLTGGLINIVTLVITAQIRGDVLHNPGLGYAVAMGMVVIIGISILFYSMLQRRSERWLRG